VVTEAEVDVYYPCAYCDGSGFLTPPSGQVGMREGGKATCKACGGTGETRKRIPLSKLGLQAPTDTYDRPH
jgi:DnaJ-class molecular chaperone